MSFPPPSVPPAGDLPPASTAAAMPSGWYDDPWDPRALRWWDGTTWTGYTDAQYGPGAGSFAGDAMAVELVRRSSGPARVLAALLPLAPLGQVASLATSSSGMRDLFRQVRDGEVLTQATTEVTGWMAIGQVVSLLTIVLLVLRMVWLLRATRACRGLDRPTRRGPGWACAGWILPLLNFWWPYRGVRDVVGDDPGQHRMLVWWWTTYLVGALGSGLALMATWSLSVPASLAVMAVPTASLLVSSVLERRLVLAAQARLEAGVGLNPV